MNKFNLFQSTVMWLKLESDNGHNASSIKCIFSLDRMGLFNLHINIATLKFTEKVNVVV